MSENKVIEFKLACERYLNGLAVLDLRVYGRYLGLRNPTAIKKHELIQKIIGVLCGEITETQTARGAPIKNTNLNFTVINTINQYASTYLSDKDIPKDIQEKKEFFDFSKTKEIGIIRELDEEGKVSLSNEFRQIMGLKLFQQTEQRLYKDENDEYFITIRKVK